MSCNIIPDFARNMQRDPSGKGFMHLGKDGVLRTLSPEHKVIDAKGLNPEQIKQMLGSLPSPVDKGEFDGIDGTTLPAKQWYNPAAGILPKICTGPTPF